MPAPGNSKKCVVVVSDLVPFVYRRDQRKTYDSADDKTQLKLLQRTRGAFES